MHTLTIAPGVKVEETPTLLGPGWTQSQWIRFREGLPEKRGGFSHLNSTALTGLGRGIKAWADLSGVPYLGVGTDQRLQVFANGMVSDITPIFRASDISNPFSTQANSNVVTITDPGYVPSVGDWVFIATLTYVGGLVLQGFFQVKTVVGGSYTIQAATNATQAVAGGGTVLFFTATQGSATVVFTLGAATFNTGDTITVNVSTLLGGITLFGPFAVTNTGGTLSIAAPNLATQNANASENGGQVELRYILPSGIQSAASQSGYGIGQYGIGQYGIGSASSSTKALTQWFLDQWGSFLIGNRAGGTLYVWQPPVATGNVATPTGGSTPSVIQSSFVASPTRMVIALGADPGNGIFDPNLIRWSDADDFTDWIATAVNQAGSYRIPTGSRIVGGLQGPTFGCIWTDVDFWMQQYLQPPLVYGFIKVASGCGLLSARGAGVLNDIVYWISQNNFMKFDGNSVSVVPCTVWDKIFKNLNQQQLDKVFCAVNSHFREVIWFYPSLNATEIDSYVCYSDSEGTWDYGALPIPSMVRTCWTDDNTFGPPIGTDINGLLQQHDNEGVYDADAQPLPFRIRTGFMSIADGTFRTFIERLVNDFILTNPSGNNPNPSMTITLFVQDEPNSTIYQKTLTVTPATKYSVFRMRGRAAAVEFASSALGVFWRFGAMRHNGVPAGRRY